MSAVAERNDPPRNGSSPAPTEAPAAAAAGLRYVSDAMPGISRQRCGKGFRYFEASGTRLDDPATIARIRALAVPPAWRGVWICPLPDGHLQATGRDARGRKQYRYHDRWREVRDSTKFDRLAGFGHVLPKLRARVAADLDLPGMPLDKVLASVVRLMDATCMRVGNERYARDNGSFGATTLRNEHVRVNGSEIRLSFRGKSGKLHRLALSDPQLARIVRRCRDLPGYELFQYVDDQGNVRAVDAADVNEYLHSVAGERYTAKDLRTWAATVLAAAALLDCTEPSTQVEAQRNVAHAVQSVAMQLGNTPAICRNGYIHPFVIEAYAERMLSRIRPHRRGAQELAGVEAALLRLLDSRGVARRSGARN